MVLAIKNEKGYTLILVLLIMTVIFITATGLSSLAISTRLQFNKTEEQNKATDLAEMGITYYQEQIRTLIETANETSLQLNTSFCTEFTSLYNESDFYTPKMVDGQNRYQITSHSAADCIDTSRFTIHFSSTGTTAKGEAKELKGSLLVAAATRAGERAPQLNVGDYITVDTGNNFEDFFLVSNQNYYYRSEPKLNENDSHIIRNPSAWFESLTLKGNSDRTIHFQHDAIFNHLFISGQTEIIIEGDAIFFDKEEAEKNIKGKASLCVKGNIYYVDSDGILQVDGTLLEENKCSDSTIHSNWRLDPVNGLSVQYTPSN